MSAIDIIASIVNDHGALSGALQIMLVFVNIYMCETLIYHSIVIVH